MPNIVNNFYYQIKPCLPRFFQIFIRRQLACLKQKYLGEFWYIPKNIFKPPKTFLGWPDNKKFALVLTHDVDTARGQENVIRLMELEKELGFRSSFNFVPERYQVSESIRKKLIKEGFEVGVHGLNHDGKLFKSKYIFEKRILKINEYLNDWKALGFRAPAMHHNLDWIHSLKIEYDCSTFDIDPFEPQSDGCSCIFPYFVEKKSNDHFYIELPYTLPQDFTLFILLKDYDFEIWRRKLDWLANQWGMVLLNTHPDYMNFDKEHNGYDQYHANLYNNFLKWINISYPQQYWHALPKEISNFWKSKVAVKG